METRTLITWQAKEYDFVPKARSWYWAVGIIAGGIAAASFILSNYLLVLIAILAGFTIMLVGSAKPKRHTYRLTEKGFMIGPRLISFRDMRRFAVHEDDDGGELLIETNTISGTISVPLGDADYRLIEMELKNQNIEEVESLHSFADHLARGIGI